MELLDLFQDLILTGRLEVDLLLNPLIKLLRNFYTIAEFEESCDLRTDELALRVLRLPLSTRVVVDFAYPLGLKRVNRMSLRGFRRFHVRGRHNCAGPCD